MTIANRCYVLELAEKKQFAVPAFNVSNLSFATAIIEAANLSQSPVILMIAERHYRYMDLPSLTAGIFNLAYRSSVPVVLHLDHAETKEAMLVAIDAKFTSAMFDGSSLPFEQNKSLSKSYVQLLRSYGLSVEGEVGKVGGCEGDMVANMENLEEFYSDPVQCEQYVKETGIDALAVAVGNAHGYYPFPPKLNFELIKEIKQRCNIPLVLHGGSGISEEGFRQAIECGIRKINIYSDLSHKTLMAARRELAEEKSHDFAIVQHAIYKESKKLACYYMNLFGSAHKL